MEKVQVRAKSYRDARREIEQRYGKDVLILSERKIKRAWPLSLFKPGGVEVVVGIKEQNDERLSEIEIRKRNIAKRLAKQAEEEKAAEVFRKQIEELASKELNQSSVERIISAPLSQAVASYSGTVPLVAQNAVATSKKPLFQNDHIPGDLQQVASERKLITEVTPQDIVRELEKKFGSKIDAILKEVRLNQGFKHYEEPFGEIYRQLIDADFDWSLSERLVEGIIRENRNATREEAWKKIIDRISHLLGEPQPIRISNEEVRVIVLLGPTGVGKTTTLAKLASQFSLSHNLAVGLITADTYRMAATQQLEKYAEILDVPLHVVYSENQIRDAIEAFSDKDIILIDTAGRSPKHKEQMKELERLLEQARADESYLVINSTTRPKEMIETYERFKKLNPDKLIFTKLDEGSAFGGIVNLVAKSKLPIGYVTTGQEVPDDIQVPDPKELALRVLGKVGESENEV